MEKLSSENFEKAKQVLSAYRGKGYAYLPSALQKLKAEDFRFLQAKNVKVYRYDVKARVCGYRLEDEVRYTREFLVEYTFYVSDNAEYAKTNDMLYAASPDDARGRLASDMAKKLYSKQFRDIGYTFDKAFINDLIYYKPETVDEIAQYMAEMAYGAKGKTQKITVYVQKISEKVSVEPPVCVGAAGRAVGKVVLGILIVALVLFGIYQLGMHC